MSKDKLGKNDQIGKALCELFINALVVGVILALCVFVAFVIYLSQWYTGSWADH